MKELIITISVFIFGVIVGYQFPYHKTEVKTVSVEVIENSAKCAKEGGKLVGHPIMAIGSDYVERYGYYSNFDCYIPAKTITP